MDRSLSPLLIIGNKNYSSWSLRTWLLLKGFNIEFEEQLIQLFDSSATPTLEKYSVTGKVPALVINRDDAVNQVAITDSLAIGIFANDYLTDLDIWSGLNKADIDNASIVLQKQRGFCQSIVSEMHSSFNGVRNEMPMNIRATAKIKPSEQCLTDLRRIEDIFQECLEQEQLLKGRTLSNQQDNYLFGKFTIADAFYAPIVLRLKTYAENSGLTLRPTTQQYMQVMLNNPHIQSWCADALQETRVLEEDEAGEILSSEGVLAT